MSALITHESVAVIVGGRGLNIQTYKSRFHAIMELLNTGYVADGLGGASYGCEEHLRALDEIESKIAEVRVSIAAENAKDGEEYEE